jgi:hypothetical protein
MDDVREVLANIAADLLSERQYTPFLRRLLAGPSGSWRSVAPLCEGLPRLAANACEAFQSCGERFTVTHLAWPGLPPDDPGRMVLFFLDEDFWSFAAYFNTAAVNLVP